VLEGEPVVVIRECRVLYRQLHRCRITHKDLLSARSQHECMTPSEVALAVVEPNGSISVRKRQG
jgi:uncharacterized membrane protein YcaP (DUF421 family)